MGSLTKPAKGVPVWQHWRDRFRTARKAAIEAAAAPPAPPTLRPPPRSAASKAPPPAARPASVFARRG